MHVLSSSIIRLFSSQGRTHLPCSKADRPVTSFTNGLRHVWTDAPGQAAPETAFYDSTLEQVPGIVSAWDGQLHMSITEYPCGHVVCTGADRDSFLTAGQTWLVPAIQKHACTSGNIALQMLEFGRAALYNNSFVLDSACRVQREVQNLSATDLLAPRCKVAMVTCAVAQTTC